MPVAVTQSSSVGVAIRYVLPVLWMTLWFYIMAIPCVRHVHSSAAIEHDKHNSRDFNQILLNDKERKNGRTQSVVHRGRSLLSTTAMFTTVAHVTVDKYCWLQKL